LFRGFARVLRTHRGYDPGALDMARDLARALQAPLVYATVSRLLVELNRSLHHRGLWSQATRGLSSDEKARIVERYYTPYRDRVLHIVGAAVRGGHRVVHISSHSFTPVLDGEVRDADVGLLYDPRRRGEVELVTRWKRALHERAPALRVRRNYPYAGTSDGLTTFLRAKFPAERYAGIELELNQKWVAHRSRRGVRKTIVTALQEALAA
jgi:predicted N-formylglutamate amidohydrolase